MTVSYNSSDGGPSSIDIVLGWGLDPPLLPPPWLALNCDDLQQRSFAQPPCRQHHYWDASSCPHFAQPSNASLVSQCVSDTYFPGLLVPE